MSIDAGNIVSVTLTQRYQESTILNVFHYQWDGVTVPTANYNQELDNLIDEFYAKVWAGGAGGNGIQQRQVSAVSMVSIRAQPVYLNRDVYRQKNYADTGDIPEVGLPSNSAVGIALRTDRVFKGATGNKRFAGVPIPEYNGTTGEITLNYLADWNDTTPQFGLRLLDVATNPNWRPVVWSTARPIQAGNIVGANVSRAVRTQHSRTKGVGI